jgi:hypothetical protein
MSKTNMLLNFMALMMLSLAAASVLAEEVVVSVPEGMEVRLVPEGTAVGCVEVNFIPLDYPSGALCPEPTYDPYDPNEDGVMEWQGNCVYDPCNPDAPVVCP